MVDLLCDNFGCLLADQWSKPAWQSHIATALSGLVEMMMMMMNPVNSMSTAVHSMQCYAVHSVLSAGQRAVMLCDWGVKANMVLFAGNTV